jgi:hypothetical protein
LARKTKVQSADDWTNIVSQGMLRAISYLTSKMQSNDFSTLFIYPGSTRIAADAYFPGAGTWTRYNSKNSL